MQLDWSRIKLKYVLEVMVLLGLLFLWISYMIQTVNVLHQASSDKEQTVHGLEIPIYSRIFFFIGDLMYASGGTLLLFRFKEGMNESVKLTWSMLFIGFTISAHIPIVIRAWIFRSMEFKNSDESDATRLAWPALSTAIATAIAIVLTITAAMSVDWFSGIGSENAVIKNTGKWLIVLGIACGELFFIAGIIEYEQNSTIYSSIVLLVLSLFFSIVGYVPGRIMTVFKDRFDDEEVPLMRPS